MSIHYIHNYTAFVFYFQTSKSQVYEYKNRQHVLLYLSEGASITDDV